MTTVWHHALPYLMIVSCLCSDSRLMTNDFSYVRVVRSKGYNFLYVTSSCGPQYRNENKHKPRPVEREEDEKGTEKNWPKDVYNEKDMNNEISQEMVVPSSMTRGGRRPCVKSACTHTPYKTKRPWEPLVAQLFSVLIIQT